MDKKRLAQFEKILRTRRWEPTRSPRRQPARSSHRAAGAWQRRGRPRSNSHDKELMFERSIRARGLLAAIDTALARISSGTFGECVICGQEIGAKRFEAVPWTRYCLACQESAEKEG